jgi:hypothetical protein
MTPSGLMPNAAATSLGAIALTRSARRVQRSAVVGRRSPAPAMATPDARTQAQFAIDIYQTLPEHERATISKELATRLGPLWFGDRTQPDEDAAAQPVCARTLTDTLMKRGHLTVLTEPAHEQLDIGEPQKLT